MTFQDFKNTIEELGFVKTKTLGMWSHKLCTNVKLFIFTRGDFWVKDQGVKVFNANYYSINKDILIKNLFEIEKSA